MTPTEAAREIIVSIQACGAWPKQRESAVQLEKQIEDTLARYGKAIVGAIILSGGKGPVL